MTADGRSSSWPQADLRHVCVFLTLCEELHFGRTAERLGITPSYVSQTIRTLEARVGAKLFVRTSRRVGLTALGERLAADLGPAYEQLQRAFRTASDAANEISGMVRVGSYFGLNLGPYWVRIVGEFERHHPSCRVEFVDTGTQRNYLDRLRVGDVDMLAARLPLEQPDIAIGPILSHERRLLMVASHDPLASRDAVSVEDFADRLIDYPPDFPREMVDAFVPAASPSGRRLRRIPTTTVEEVRLRVARGEMVHATVQSLVDHWGHPSTTFVPITDLPPSQTALVWLTANRSAKIDAFIRAAADVLARSELAPHQPRSKHRPPNPTLQPA
jgi:DNA-binding transcriptional LysR family regulator